jgi:hypothetical protein
MLKQLLVLAVVLCASTAHATVPSENRSDDFTCSGATSYTYTFPVLTTSDLVVTKYTGACGSATYTVLSLAGGYTATRTTTGGTVTLGSACGSGYCLRISRVVDVTQTTSFRTQGTFNPAAHENAFDKLTMAVQQVQDGVTQSEETATAIANHIASADDHTQYLKLTGRSGGQTAYGGTASGDDLYLRSTTHGTKGTIFLGTSTYAEAGQDLSLADDLAVAGAATISETLQVTLGLTALGGISGTSDSYGDLYLRSNSGAIDGHIYFDDNSAYFGFNQRLGIADTTPDFNLDVNGDAMIKAQLYLDDLVAGTGYISSTSSLVKGAVSIGSMFIFDEATSRMGIVDVTPETALDVTGEIELSDNTRLHAYATSGLQLKSNAGTVRMTISPLESADPTVSQVGFGGSAWNDPVITYSYPCTLTIADDGGGTHAAGTMAPECGNTVICDCNDSTGCTITVTEGDTVDGMQVVIVGDTATHCDFADSAGVLELAGGTAFAMGDGDTLSLLYIGDTWVETSRSDN